MNELYDYLRLNKENALDIPVSANVIAEHVKSRKKKTALEAELSNVSKILIKYSLKGKRWIGDVELQIIEITVREPKQCKPIMEAFADAIPYPVLLVFVSKGKCLLCLLDTKDILCYGDYITTRWIYEEELRTSFLEYNSIEPYDCHPLDGFLLDSPPELTDFDAIEIVLGCLTILTDELDNLDYICLRMLIDLLKIREVVWGESYVYKVIMYLYEKGDLFLLDDDIYIAPYTHAEDALSAASEYPWKTRTLLDERFGSDMHFYELSGEDLTSRDETEKIIADILHQEEMIERLIDESIIDEYEPFRGYPQNENGDWLDIF